MTKKPTEYEALRAIWYKKLEKEGFKDIEQEDGNLKVWALKFNNSKFQQEWKSRESYFYLATQFLNDYKFTDNVERVIWEYHVNGLFPRDITKILKKTRVAKTNRTTVWYTIKRLEESMKKMYLTSQYSE